MSARRLSWLLFFCCLALYLPTAARDVYWFDSPELTTAAANLDIAHAPGYPLWTGIGHLFSRIPAGSLAFRVSVFSALSAAAAVALFFRFLVALGLRVPSAMAGACALAWLPQFWELAVIQEVYAFEMTLLAGLLLSLAPGRDGRPMPNVVVSAFLAGCLVAHRPTAALFLPFLLGLAPLPLAMLPRAVAGFALAYLPYLHTWWHLQNRFSMLYFDYPKDAATFFSILTGQVYAGHLFSMSGSEALQELRSFLALMRDQFGCAGLGLAVAGLAASRARRRPELLTLLGVAMVNLTFCVNHNAIETNTMLLPTLAMGCWLLALGVDELLLRAEAGGGKRATGLVAGAVAALLLSWIPGSYRACDRSGFAEVTRYLDDLYQLLPRGAALVTTSDVDAASVLYGRFALGARSDVSLTILERWDAQVESTIAESLARGKTVFGSLFLGGEEFESAARAFRLRRQGFLYRLEPLDAGPDKPGEAVGEEVSPGIRLDRASVATRLVAAPRLCTIAAAWTLRAERAIGRPGAVMVLCSSLRGPGGTGSGSARPVWCGVQPIGGLSSGRPVPGRWEDSYRFRIAGTLLPGRYELRLGVADLARAESEIQLGRATGVIEAFDPSELQGLDRWKEREMQFVASIRECVPYRARSWRVTDPERFLGWAGGRTVSLGLVNVTAAERDGG